MRFLKTGKCESQKLALGMIQFKPPQSYSQFPLLPRTALLIFAIAAMDAAWLLEQPRSSMLHWHPRMQQLWSSVPKVGKEHGCGNPLHVGVNVFQKKCLGLQALICDPCLKN